MRLQCPKCNVVNILADDERGTSSICGNCGQVNEVPDTYLAKRVVFHDFAITKVLRRGSDGIEVYAHQLSLDRSVVLKILTEDLSTNSEYVNLFVKRARLAGALNHPNLTPVYLVAKEYDLYFVVREAVETENVRDILSREGKLDLHRAIAIFHGAAEGLGYAWRSSKLMHGNLKPAYLCVTKAGGSKVSDVGLASIDLGDEPDKIKGTPQYISPEQILGEQADTRSDIYSLGCNFYQCLTGSYPYVGESTIDIFQQHLQSPLRLPSELDPSIPGTVCQIIAKMLAKNMDDRYQSFEELAQDLQLVAQGNTPHHAAADILTEETEEEDDDDLPVAQIADEELPVAQLDEDDEEDEDEDDDLDDTDDDEEDDEEEVDAEKTLVSPRKVLRKKKTKLKMNKATKNKLTRKTISRKKKS